MSDIGSVVFIEIGYWICNSKLSLPFEKKKIRGPICSPMKTYDVVPWCGIPMYHKPGKRPEGEVKRQQGF